MTTHADFDAQASQAGWNQNPFDAMKIECATTANTRPQNEVEEIFALAMAFRRAAKLCYYFLIKSQSMHISSPLLANTALATEHALKCLLKIRHRKIPWEHDLHKLFCKLDEIDQLALSSAYQSHYASPEYALIFQVPELPAPESYEESTRLNKDVFVNFRYPGKDGVKKSSALSMTLDIALNHLLDLQPSLLRFKLETDDPDEQFELMTQHLPLELS